MEWFIISHAGSPLSSFIAVPVNGIGGYGCVAYGRHSKEANALGCIKFNHISFRLK